MPLLPAAVIGTTSSGRTTGAAASLTISHTVPAGASSLVVLIGQYGSLGTISSVTYNGVALTRAGRPYNNTNHRGEAWVMPSPTAGTANIVITPGSSDYLVAMGVNVENSGNVIGVVLAQAASGNPSTTIPSDTDSVVIDLVMNDNASATFTPGGSQTQLFAQSGVAGSDERGAGSWRAGASGTTTMSWTIDGADYGHLVVAVSGVGVSSAEGGGFIR
jgi:hypothetical protein